MTMDYMPMYSPLIPIRCGGTGAGRGDSRVRTGALTGDGIHLGIITAGIHPTGVEVTGDMDGTIITIIILTVIIIRITDGVEDTMLTDIQTIVPTDIGEMVHHGVITCHRDAMFLVVDMVETPVYAEVLHRISEE